MCGSTMFARLSNTIPDGARAADAHQLGQLRAVVESFSFLLALLFVGHKSFFTAETQSLKGKIQIHSQRFSASAVHSA